MRKIWLIIFALVIAIGIGVYFLYISNNNVQMTLIVKFKEAPPVIQGIIRGKTDIYYRGYRVGKVSKITLSEDQKHILFYLDIYYKGLRLPENTKVYLRTQDIFGDRYFDLVYPENPSARLLSDGDIITGTSVFERLDKYLVQTLQAGRLSKLISNLTYLSSLITGYVSRPQTRRELQAAVENINELIASEELQEIIAIAPQTLTRTVAGLEEVSVGLPQVSTDIKQASTDIQQASTDIQQASRNILEVGETVTHTNKAIWEVNETLPEVTQTVSVTNALLDNTNTLIVDTNCNLSSLNCKIPRIPPGFIENANETIKRYDCIGIGLSKMLSERFLLFRIMFGNPGEFLDECIRIGDDDCIEINPACFDNYEKKCE
ncbi:MAG: hypothetical protein A2287_10795 [Candidatus Melainabacteria bacterium RIFOXYA12_FULL_32_12]|nr:MAG: hypothetical protein A2287_10795 [Candidatus Melainabacteria bacterium RIFOXYA12_FULL_32_12]